jgi:hypothetical protein
VLHEARKGNGASPANLFADQFSERGRPGMQGSNLPRLAPVVQRHPLSFVHDLFNIPPPCKRK